MIQKLKSHCSRCGLTNLLPFPICYFITAGHCRHKIFLLAWLTSINFYCQSTQAPFLLPRWLGGKESACQCRKCRFDSWSGKILCRRKWQPTSVFLPGNFHGQRSLAGYSPWGRRVGHDWSDLAHICAIKCLLVKKERETKGNGKAKSSHTLLSLFFHSESKLHLLLSLTLLYNGILANRLRFQHAWWNKGHRVQGKKSGEGKKKKIITRPSILEEKKCGRSSGVNDIGERWEQRLQLGGAGGRLEPILSFPWL